MTIIKENAENIATENIFIENDDHKVLSWYGGEYFEIADAYNNLAFTTREQFLAFAEMVIRMKDEITRKHEV